MNTMKRIGNFVAGGMCFNSSLALGVCADTAKKLNLKKVEAAVDKVSDYMYGVASLLVSSSMRES